MKNVNEELPGELYAEPTLPEANGIGVLPALPTIAGPNRAQRRAQEKMFNLRGDLQKKPKSRNRKGRK